MERNRPSPADNEQSRPALGGELLQVLIQRCHQSLVTPGGAHGLERQSSLVPDQHYITSAW